ncbi:hypothetical protein CC86DRAFT_432210 [Ophiobolus disseminans]|uniref:Ecp2 effector protein domain-containing protein n=1 Tax=Ophiobolus disseminans TaxID=1469910 RepID=A0A6A6ZDG3_9PLEO|nr:hypothetical protein CC86DRAFT_432210 [Ophiobolus disseminans]
MDTFSTFLFWLLLSLLALTRAAHTANDFNTTAPAPAGYDPSIEYHGHATAEIWMGRWRTNIGDVTGTELYLKMYEQLQKHCYGGRDGCTFSGEGRIATHVMYSGDKVAESMYIHECEWTSDQSRKLLIGSMASTVQALTTALSNCVDGPQGWRKFCNISNYITVNFPTIGRKRNYLHARFYGGTLSGEFKCCASRVKVDRAIDWLGGEIGSLFGQSFRGETRCIINGWKMCTSEP